MSNESNHEGCSVHERTMEILDAVTEHNNNQDALIDQIMIRTESMETRIINIESNVDKIKKYGVYVLLFIVGNATNPETINMFINLVDKLK